MAQITRIVINGDLAQVADRFELPRLGTDWFTGRVRNQPVEIAVGYQGETLTQLHGEADEWELRWTDRGLTGGLRGRDLGQRLIERRFKKIYYRFPPNPIPTKPVIIGGIVVGSTVLPYAVGAFTARQIAEEIAASVGLSLQWQLPDWKIQESALALSASAGECLRRLVGTIGQPEMFSVDLYTTGTMLIVRQRQATYAVPDYQLSLDDLMGTDITYRSSAGPIYGEITITGAGISAEVDRPEDLPEEVDLPPEIVETPRAFPTKARARVTTNRHILRAIPNEVLLRETALTELELDFSQDRTTAGAGSFYPVAETRKVINYDEQLLLDKEGRINLPVKVSEQSVHFAATTEVREIPDPADETKPKKVGGIGPLHEVRRETTTYGYNDDKELVLQDTLIEEILSSVSVTLPSGARTTGPGPLIPTRRQLLRNQRVDANQYQTTTQIWTVQTVPNAAGALILADQNGLQLEATDVKVTRGQLPGPQRIRRPKRGAGTGGSPTRVIRDETISTDPDAIDVAISDANLTSEVADRLLDQFRQASGKWRHEVTIRHVALPFLRKGTILGWSESFPNLPAVPPNALVTARCQRSCNTPYLWSLKIPYLLV